VTDLSHRFRSALETRDSAAAAALMADGVVFRSPVVFKPYVGRDAVGEIMTAVFRVFDDWRCVRELGTSARSKAATSSTSMRAVRSTSST